MSHNSTPQEAHEAGGPPVRPSVQRARANRKAVWKLALLAVLRLVAVILIQAAALWLAALILPGVSLTGVRAPVVVSVAMLIATFVIWPLFIRFFFKLAVWTAGLITFVVNGLIVVIAASLAPELEVANLGWAVLYAIVVTVILTLFLGIISFDDVGVWRRLLGRRQRRLADPTSAGKPGVVFLEIDGLSHDALVRAMAAGKARNMRRWKESGSHRLVPWECDLSSQTSASQAGILHGNNNEMPAFRWYDKTEGRVIVSSKPLDLGRLEADRSNGKGLLAHGGSARASMFSGDADEVMLVASRLREEKTDSYRAFFFSPYSFTRTMILVLWEVLLEIGAKWRQRVRNEQPRIRRGFKYALVRAGMTVALRDFSVNVVVGDMLRGVPYCYATLAGYDEVAHHSGLDRHDTLTVLRKLDARLRHVEHIAEISPRQYELVVLSDHGQTMGATFLQRYDLTLEDLVQSLVSQGTSVGGPSTYAKAGASAGVAEGQSDWEHVSTVDDALKESGMAKGRAGTAVRRRLAARQEAPLAVTDVVVLASGNLGLISFTGVPRRLTAEEIERDHAGLVENLAAHPGVGFVMVATSSGTAAIGELGRRYLDDDRVDGEDPLAPYGPNAARHLRRSDGFRTCPDILVMSTFWPETGDNAAFEELVGNHGGLGGEQCHGFLLFPAAWRLEDEELVGAESVYRNLKSWTHAAS